MVLTGLDHVQIAMPAGQEDRARQFYQDLLGFIEVVKPEPLASRGGCWFEAPGAIVHLGVESEFSPARKAHPAFKVSDLDTLRMQLEEAGVPVVPDQVLPGVERFYASDPFGNRIEFIQDGDGFSQKGSVLMGQMIYEPLAEDEEEVQRRHEANRQGWNQGALSYRAEIEETIAFLRAGGSNLHPIERQNLGDLKSWCQTAIHLQCASGRDTLSLWNEGVQHVIGVDISDVHIENAHQISAALGAPADWYRADVLDTPHELDGMADLVYTGRGSLVWLHDIEGWAQVVYRLLKPGGVFHILEGHPVTWLFDQSSSVYVASGLDFFAHAESSRGWSPTYIGDMGMDIEEHDRKYERLWPVSVVHQALIRSGLVIEHFGEYGEHYWNAFPNLRPELQGRIPMTYSLMARKPAG